MTKLQFLEKRCRNQRRELSSLNKKFAGWWCYLRKVYSEPDSPLAQLTVLQHKFKPVEKERNKLRHENKQLKKRVAELEAALDETECYVLTITEDNRKQIGDYWNYKVGQEVIVECMNGGVIGTPKQCPNLYKWLKEKQK